MESQNHYDVVIIGTGAGGGTLAYRLAPSGKKILLVERGGCVPREKDNWNSRAVNVEGKYNTKEIWHDKDGPPLPTTTSEVTRSFMVQRSFVCVARTSVKSSTTMVFRLPGRFPMKISNLTIWKPKPFTRCTVGEEKARPSLPQAAPTLIRLSAMNPVCSN
jgi:hypothetical protein